MSRCKRSLNKVEQIRETAFSTVRIVGCNFAVLDQVAALSWVANHIVAFGGNADNVTIFDQSAGALAGRTLLSVIAHVDYSIKLSYRVQASNHLPSLQHRHMAHASTRHRSSDVLELFDSTGVTWYEALDQLFTTAIWVEPAFATLRRFEDYNAIEEKISKAVQSAWIEFARNGVSRSPDGSPWRCMTVHRRLLPGPKTRS